MIQLSLRDFSLLGSLPSTGVLGYFQVVPAGLNNSSGLLHFPCVFGLDLLEVWIQNRHQSRGAPDLARSLRQICENAISPLRCAPVEMTN